jgi:hypothetical protein
MDEIKKKKKKKGNTERGSHQARGGHCLAVVLTPMFSRR